MNFLFQARHLSESTWRWSVPC